MNELAVANNLELALKRRDAELATMVEIGKTLTSTLQLDEILEVIMEQVSSLLQPKAWSLLLVDEESGDLVFEIAVSPTDVNLKGTRLERGAGIAGWVAEHGEPLLIPDVNKDSRFCDVIDRAASFTTRSVICIPVKSRERTLGVVELVNSLVEESFNEADLKILTTIADFAAIAIENAKIHDEVRLLAVTDELTGLWNARRFNELLEYEFERSKRYGGELSLIFIDLDHFKSVNDTHGHLVGSRLLSEVGRLLGRSIRKVDSAARFGGDEFVLMFPNTSKEWGRVLAERLCRILRETEFRGDNGALLNVTGSFGVAAYPDDADSSRELLGMADKAMYQVKETSRNAVGLAVGKPCK
ncbi:sensor domain-containing diguanylate cyclase [Geobacter pelophilus]|uniref:diguanylate cyclase n=1 Tax=Geoanaerobacter pelophilus TaxID=60036 RepID=A0AAW4L745_9BACT|nr:sensor domain-containing diguanylate cyclase [Geoanaerobacter pelophilus]MBT0664868.1 sensor domain-containing diguanylate cyclase [Geoanaerobacter pelophilus]